MNGLKLIRAKCNVSLSQLADILDVSRQQVSAWENGRKMIPEKRLKQLSEYFGIDAKYFSEISEEDKDFIESKDLYRRCDSEKECYCFFKQAEIKGQFNGPYSFPDFKESLDQELIQAKKRKKESLKNIENVMDYFGKSSKIGEKIAAINRGCKVYDALTIYMNRMPDQAPGTTMAYYYMDRNVLFSLLLSQDLMTREEVEKEFERGVELTPTEDISWICEQAEAFKQKYEEKRTADEAMWRKVKPRLKRWLENR